MVEDPVFSSTSQIFFPSNDLPLSIFPAATYGPLWISLAAAVSFPRGNGGKRFSPPSQPRASLRVILRLLLESPAFVSAFFRATFRAGTGALSPQKTLRAFSLFRFQSEIIHSRLPTAVGLGFFPEGHRRSSPFLLPPCARHARIAFLLRAAHDPFSNSRPGSPFFLSTGQSCAMRATGCFPRSEYSIVRTVLKHPSFPCRSRSFFFP